MRGGIPGDPEVQVEAVAIEVSSLWGRRDSTYEVKLTFVGGEEAFFPATKAVADWMMKAHRIMEAAQ